MKDPQDYYQKNNYPLLREALGGRYDQITPHNGDNLVAAMCSLAAQYPDELDGLATAFSKQVKRPSAKTISAEQNLHRRQSWTENGWKLWCGLGGLGGTVMAGRHLMTSEERVGVNLYLAFAMMSAGICGGAIVAGFARILLDRMEDSASQALQASRKNDLIAVISKLSEEQRDSVLQRIGERITAIDAYDTHRRKLFGI